MRRATSSCNRRLTGATRRSGTPRPTTITACLIERAAYGLRRGFATPNNPAFCKKGSGHPSAKVFPLERTNRQLTMLDPKTGQYTFVDTCFGSIICSLATTQTRPCGPAAVDRWSDGSTPRCSTRPATSRNRKAGRRSFSTPTATANATSTSSPINRSTRPKTNASSAGFYAVMPNPVDGSVWGTFRT